MALSKKQSSFSTLFPSFLLPPAIWRLLHRFILFTFSLLLRLLLLLLSSLSPPPSSSAITRTLLPSSSSARSLFQILSLIPFIPLSSRKYHLALSLADRLLRENLVSSLLRPVNRAALSAAFASTVSQLEAAVYFPLSGPADLITGAVRSGLRRIGAVVEERGGVGDGEKLTGEVMWLAQRMVECGAGGETVERWAAAGELGRTAILADSRVQAGLVKVSVFLFKYAHRMHLKVYERVDGSKDDEENITKCSECCISMLRTWLPLLCRANNGVDMPVLSSCERSEMTGMIEEMIERLKWEEREEVLAIWLHHFTSCPDSDWPNLESCYTRWYAESRNFLLS